MKMLLVIVTMVTIIQFNSKAEGIGQLQYTNSFTNLIEIWNQDLLGDDV